MLQQLQTHVTFYRYFNINFVIILNKITNINKLITAVMNLILNITYVSKEQDQFLT